MQEVVLYEYFAATYSTQLFFQDQANLVDTEFFALRRSENSKTLKDYFSLVNFIQ